LFSSFHRGAERTLWDEGKAGFIPLNDLYLYGGKLNREKNKKGQAIKKVVFLGLPFFYSQTIF